MESVTTEKNKLDTNRLKRFAKEARRKLHTQVGTKLDYVLTATSTDLLDKAEQIGKLKEEIQVHGRDAVIEKVAYTWFNRLMALRFMDANNYTSPKVVTPTGGHTVPEILQEAKAGNIDDSLLLDKPKLNNFLDNKGNVTDAQTEAFKMLLIAACNSWHSAMPFMFEKIRDYTELLLPDDLLSEFSIVTDIREAMKVEDCEQEELIGWLYQFYIAEKKDEVFEGLKKNKKITPENIPAATQLFTPRWIVRYMVENTLGKLWITFKPESKIRQFMPYFIEAPETSPSSQEGGKGVVALAPLPEGITSIKDITFLDPCTGSGHVLVYAFELFAHIYEEEGFATNEIPALILENNLFGIDIDERAAQLAAFALTMKARSRYNRHLRKPVQPHIMAMENIAPDVIEKAVRLPLVAGGKIVTEHKDLSLYQLTQADNFGSLIQIDPLEMEALELKGGDLWQQASESLKMQAEMLSRQFHCVVTNPPYMGKGMNSSLKYFVENHFPRSKTDLMACFIERCLEFIVPNGEIGMINQQAWLFLGAYKELRKYFLEGQLSIESLLQLGPNAFQEISGEMVQNVAFCFRKTKGVRGLYFKLNTFSDSTSKMIGFLEALHLKRYFIRKFDDFSAIPDYIFGYWLSDKLLNILSKRIEIQKYGQTREGLTTANNEKYLRFHWEIDHNKIHFSDQINPERHWFFYQKGGEFRKWYGNRELMLSWKNNGEGIKNNIDPKTKRVRSHNYNGDFALKEGITWTAFSGTTISARYSTNDFFDSKGSKLFPKNNLNYFLGLLNSKIAYSYLEVFSPSLDIKPGHVSKVPVEFNFIDIIENIVSDNINISKSDWDSRETSYEFYQNELIKQNLDSISEAYNLYKNWWKNLFYKIHQQEEELNKRFISIYGLEDEMTPNISLNEITILQEESRILNNQLEIDARVVIEQFLSYATGCLLGRYSLDKPGLILANQGETIQDFLNQIPNPTFLPNEDNIIPVLEGEYFEDDIVGRFREFLKVAFGTEHFDENLKFIEDTLGKDIRKYFNKDFYPDHIKRYKKRPIYWMFSSAKGSFKALIYMHRYTPALVSKMLNDYLKPFIAKMDSEKESLQRIKDNAGLSAQERNNAGKKIAEIEVALKDSREYEKKLYEVAISNIEIDLDDGVKVNYQKFRDVVVPIKGLEKEEE